MQSIRRALLTATALGLIVVPAATAQAPGAHGGMPGMMADSMHQGMQGMSGMPGMDVPGMQGMMVGMQGMMNDMMAVHAYAPEALLDRKADLGLTGEQVRKLEGLAADVKTAMTHAQAEHSVRHARIIEQFKLARPDPAKVKADGQEAMQDMAAAHGAMLSVFAQAKGLLTDAQRSKVDSSAPEHGMMMK